MGVLRLLAFLLVLAFTLPRPASAQEFEIPAVTISGGDLPHGVALAPADADAFRRRVSQLPRLEDPPSVAGTSYVVTTSYWPAAVRLEDDEDVLDVSVQGEYFPDGGYIHVMVGADDSEDAWMVLSLRQRAILDRYIRLANAGLIGESPSTVDVLAATAAAESFGVQAGAAVVEPETARALLAALARANPEPFIEEREPPFTDDSGFWLTVTLLEGRSLRYYYRVGMLTESLGTERYDATIARDLMAGITPDPAATIEQERPAGSLLWWPVMVGGGLAAIGVAVWLRRRSTS